MDQTLTELTEKQVINLCDGRILGNVVDFKIDICCGRLTAIVLPGEGGIFGFKRCTDIVIPWEKICKIGKDTIIVDIGIEHIDECCKGKKSRKFLG
ncbi:MAG: YlmC/YmxH family sporulation protein [Clostridia bacterium]|nr:YlmC/YmxH family sporulation protein [Clostridia bacterium]